MAHVILSFDPDSVPAWDLALQLVEAGHKVSLCAIHELQLPTNRIEVSRPALLPAPSCPSQQ